MPTLAELESWLGPIRVTPAPIPHDCSDGFLAAYWRCPTAYLDNRLRAAMSPFQMLGDVSEGLTKLNDDLRSGDWTRRYGHLADLIELDCGYRFVTAG
ncbi:hypothetical protein SAMN05444004_11213 [Jannaschia faecimaris]|uniref:Uncharacterized protein n=1 Tax=Jannaschia faecimaris TaxID=1244108 RepID=A0A1H3SH71_9RHOB|nr:hypothetical protein [Jannaschia faecimaris]SDZ37312.1 hypothetical protein SAMN05444004_11213 [Jannaschia faecimaris]